MIHVCLCSRLFKDIKKLRSLRIHKLQILSAWIMIYVFAIERTHAVQTTVYTGVYSEIDSLNRHFKVKYALKANIILQYA